MSDRTLSLAFASERVLVGPVFSPQAQCQGLIDYSVRKLKKRDIYFTHLVPLTSCLSLPHVTASFRAGLCVDGTRALALSDVVGASRRTR